MTGYWLLCRRCFGSCVSPHCPGQYALVACELCGSYKTVLVAQTSVLQFPESEVP